MQRYPPHPYRGQEKLETPRWAWLREEGVRPGGNSYVPKPKQRRRKNVCLTKKNEQNIKYQVLHITSPLLGKNCSLLTKPVIGGGQSLRGGPITMLTVSGW